MEKKARKLRLDTKCDCGETLKLHPRGGCCVINGCTWFHPSIKYIRRKQKP